MKISAIIITRNEERHIKDCLNSLRFCTERIVIDNGSADKTVEIARKSGARVYAYPARDFSKIRNFAKQKAIGEWLLYIDADERVTEELADEIAAEVLQTTGQYSAYQLRRVNYFYGRKWPGSEPVVRLMKKSALKYWYGEVHESPHIAGKVGMLKNPVEHFTHDDIARMVDKTNEWSAIEAKLRLDAGHPTMTGWRFFRVIWSSFYDSYVRKSGWKAGEAGIVEGIYQAFSMFITYAKLWELQQKSKKQR